jgi:hypothetical protein
MFGKKQLFLTIGLLLFWVSGIANPWWKADTIFYNKELKVCQVVTAEFYRIGTLDTLRNIWIGNYSDYNPEHQLLRQGLKEPVSGREDGHYREFYTTGQISREGHFIRNRPSGKWTTYHPNGRIEMELYFSDRPDSLPIAINDPFQVWEFYDENGKPMIYNGTGRWEYQFPNHGLSVSGYFKDGKKAGMWRFLNEEGQLLQEEFYDEGNFRFANTFRQGSFEKTNETWLTSSLFQSLNLTVTEPAGISQFQYYPELELTVGFNNEKSVNKSDSRLPEILLSAYIDFKENALYTDTSFLLSDHAYFLGILKSNGTFRLEGILSQEGLKTISGEAMNTWHWNQLGYAVPFRQDYILVFPVKFNKSELANKTK